MSGRVPSLEAVAARLAAAGCVAAEAEAAAFLAEAPDPATLESWLRRREHGEPPAWITGMVRFCGRPVRVATGIYVPRPQTEDLARRAAALLPDNGLAVDLCTGSGAVAAHLAAEVPSAKVVGTDIDPTAAACARRNGVLAVVGDLSSALHLDRSVDVVTAVAPYVPTESLDLLPADVQAHEPRAALDGGDDGLHLVRRVIAAAHALLRPGGWLLVEVGGDQDETLAEELPGDGFDRVVAWADDDGDLRGLAAQRAAPDGH